MLQFSTNLDYQVLIWIQQNLRGSMATDFWESMTDMGNAGIFWLAVIVILLVRKKTRFAGAASFLALCLDVIITNGILKLLIARPRPFLTNTDITPLIPPPAGFSFPSGHSVSSFAVAFVLYQLLPKRYGVPAVIIAVLIALSRLYLGVHYPSDVLAGMIIGLVISKTAIWLTKKFDLSAKIDKIIVHFRLSS